MHAARMGAHVTGVDLAPRMLELASRLNPGCTFREASVDSMPFDDETFDAIVCAFGIGHFPDPPAAVAECARVARAGSICAFAWWDLPARNQMHGVVLSALDEVKPEARGRPSARACLLSLLGRRCSSRIAGIRRSLQRRRGLARFHVASAECRGAMDRVDGVHGPQFRLINAQTPEVRERIRAAFVRHATKHLTTDGLKLPMAFKVCAGAKARARPPKRGRAAD